MVTIAPWASNSPIEIRGHLQGVDIALRRGEQRVDLFARALFVAEDLQRLARVRQFLRNLGKAIDLLTDVGEFLHRFWAAEASFQKSSAWVRSFEFRYRAGLAVVVKDAP